MPLLDPAWHRSKWLALPPTATTPSTCKNLRGQFLTGLVPLITFTTPMSGLPGQNRMGRRTPHQCPCPIPVCAALVLSRWNPGAALEAGCTLVQKIAVWGHGSTDQQESASTLFQEISEGRGSTTSPPISRCTCDRARVTMRRTSGECD